jgi:putative two-component system response regulator
MAKLLIVEDSAIVRGVFKQLLDDEEFDYDLVATYAEAKALLSKTRYEFAVVERALKDAPNGEIIALFNKRNIAPLVFAKEIDEDFFESFQSAQIADFILKQKYNNISNVIQKLKQLQANKNITILVVSDSHIYSHYLKQNLNLQSFKVLTVSNDEEAYAKIELHPEIALVVVHNEEPYVNAMAFVTNVRLSKSSKDLKILALVDETNSYETSSLLNAGADDYVVKPFSRDEFYVRVYQNIKRVGTV